MQEDAAEDVDNTPTDLCVELEVILWRFRYSFGSMVSGKRFIQICCTNQWKAAVERKSVSFRWEFLKIYFRRVV